MNALQMIEMFAGYAPSGEPIAEKLAVKVNEDDNSCQLVKSPAFVKGLASGDTIRFDDKSQEFEIVKRSGNLCVRVYSQGDLSEQAQTLTSELEKLGGELDIETPRMLVYSVHVSCGFQTIEELLNQHLDAQSAWFYGNVYDPADGTTPLNWWNEILQPE